VTVTAERLAPEAPARRPARRSRRPWPILVLSVAVVAVLALPIAFLLLEAVQFGWRALVPLLFRGLTAELLFNTVGLTLVVTLFAAVLGTLSAWITERTDLPARRVLAVLIVLPVAIPDFAVAFGWKSLFPSIGGFGGAALVMTLAVYPLVYLPVAASLRHADPSQSEVARSLGAGRVATFFRVTLGQVRLAVLGGALLVALVVLAEYGAFEILGYRTFTTEIYTEFTVGFNTPASCGLSLVLVGLSLIVVLGEGAARGRGRVSRGGALTPHAAHLVPLGRAKWWVLGGVVAFLGAAVGVPLGAILYWLVRGGSSTLPPASLLSAALHTALYSAGAGLLATAMALPVALLSVRHPGRLPAILERSTYLVLAVPGLVIALGFTYVSERDANGFLYQSAFLLILAYAVMFFPLALVAVRTSLAQSPLALEEVARSLGRPRREVLLRVTLPLVGPGLAAAFCLVFLEAVTELTATLVLIPTGSQTLATQFWAFQTNTAYGQAAPYAALMVAIAALPSVVLARWFDRLPGQAGAGRRPSTEGARLGPPGTVPT